MFCRANYSLYDIFVKFRRTFTGELKLSEGYEYDRENRDRHESHLKFCANDVVAYGRQKSKDQRFRFKKDGRYQERAKV